MPAQPLSVVWKHLDIKPDKTTGLASGTIFGNDEVLCGGSQSSLWHVTAFSDSNTALAGDKDYLILASLGSWEFSAAQPFTGNRPPPGFQSIFANPTQNQGIVQPAGTSLSITGNFDLTNANVIGFSGGGGGGGSGIGISVNGSNISASAANFGIIPVAPAASLNVNFQRDALNPSNVSASVPFATLTSPGLITIAGDLCNTPLAPQVCTLHLTLPLSPAQGGTGQPSLVQAFNAMAPATISGGLIVGTGANTYGNLPPAAGTKVLTSNSGVISWTPPAGGSISAGTTNQLTRYTDGLNSIVGSAPGITDDGATTVAVTGSEQFAVKNVENTLYANEFAGADASCKIAAAITAAPPTGAIIYASNLADVGGTGACTIDPGSKHVTLYLGPFVYTVTSIVARNDFHIYGVGLSTNGSVLLSNNGNNPVVVLANADPNPVQNFTMRGVRLVGPSGINTADGIFFDATTATPAGCFWCRFDDMQILGFGGSPIHIRGGASSFSNTNQEITFDNINVYRGYCTGGNCNSGGTGIAGGGTGIVVEGANTMIQFRNSLVSSYGISGTDTYVGGYLSGTAYPYNVSIRDSVFQASDVALQVSGGVNLQFEDNHIEFNCKGVDVEPGGVVNRGLLVTGNHFAANVGVGSTSGCAGGAGTGYLLNANVASAAGITFKHNTIDGSPDVVTTGLNGSSIAYADNYYNGSSAVPPTTNVSVQITPTATINIQGSHTVALNASATAITAIQSSLGPGELVSFYALGTVTFHGNASINLSAIANTGGTGDLRLNTGDTATFVRSDLTGPWTLQAYSSLKGTAQANPNSPLIPCTLGSVLFNSASTPGQNLWFCTATDTWTQQLNSGSAGANTNLSNLLTTAINQDLLPSGTKHLGATTTPWADLFIGSASGNTLKLTGTFTANRVATFPDATDTVAELGQANVFSAANTFNANVLFGTSGRLVSGATGAPTSSCVLCFGNADRARYGTNSFNLIGVTAASSAVQLGDTPGVSLAGPITSVVNGANLSMQPAVAPTNTAGGTTAVSGGNGAGTGAAGDLILAAGSGATGTGVIQLNSPATVPCVNAPAGTTLNGLVSYSANGCVNTPLGSTSGIAGVCIEGCSTTGTAKIVRMGIAPLILDNTGVQGDYVCISSTNNNQGHDCSSPNTQTVGTVKSLISGSLYNVDVNIAGVSSGSAVGAVVLAPSGAGQTIQGTTPTTTGLIVKAPASAGASQVISQQVDNTGANVFSCAQNGTCQAGTGVGGSMTLSHVIGPNSNPAGSGIIEASNGDVIWGARNNANNADFTATINASDILAYTGKFQVQGLITTTAPTIMNEIAAPSGTASSLVNWGDSTTHWPSFNPNNVGAFRFAPIPQVNTQSGTTYTVVAADIGKLINLTSGSAIAVTVPNSTGVFGTNACFYVNAGGAGTATLTPTTATINGAASLALSSGQNAMTCADGSGNYIATVSSAGGGSGDMIKNAANVMGASGTLNGAAMSVTAGLTFPKGAGAAPTGDGIFAQDTTAHLPVFGNGTSTRVFGGNPVNTQSGTTYTFLTTDANKHVKFGNVGAVAGTLPQAGASFPNGWMAFVSNTAAGLVTITPTTSTIDGGASVTLSNGQSYCIFSDGTNYFTGCKGAQSGLGDPGSNGFAARTAANVTSARTLTGTANQINITNPTGAAGDPVFSLDTSHVLTDTNTIAGTNKTLDAEGTGNVFSRPFYAEFTPACGSPGSFDVPTSAAATFTCFGTTTTQGAADFVDASTTTLSGHFTLPQGWTGAMDVRILWFANASSANAVRWSVQTGCTGDGDATSTGPSYNTASASNTAYTGTANQQKTTALTGLTMTNCAAGEEMYFQVSRVGGDAGDTLAATAEVKAVQFRGRATN